MQRFVMTAVVIIGLVIVGFMMAGVSFVGALVITLKQLGETR